MQQAKEAVTPTPADAVKALGVIAPALDGLPPCATLTGRMLFDADSCQYADVVRAGDLIAADFDAKEVHTGGALYLVEAVEGRRVVWRGCRRMMRVPDGIAIDQDGRGDWKTIDSLDSAGWRVAGRVENVYRKQ